MKKIPFDEYEAAILVHTAVLVNEGKIKKSDAASMLSKILKSYGRKNKPDIEVNEEYRTIAGLGAQLYKAIYFLTNSNKEQYNSGKIIEDSAILYKNNPDKLYDIANKCLEMSKEKDGTIKEADMNNIIFTSFKKTASIPAVQEHNTTNQDYKNKFSEWAKDNVLFTYSEPIIEDLDNISKILKKAEICNTDIFQIKSSEEIISIYRKLKKLPDFQSKSQNAQSFYLLALQSYHFFLLQQNK